MKVHRSFRVVPKTEIEHHLPAKLVVTAIAHNPRSLVQTTSQRVGPGCTVSWTCTRLSCGARLAGTLERVQLVLSVQPIDHHHAMIEAWVESQGVRNRTIFAAQPCTSCLHEENGSFHLDAHDGRGECVVALSVRWTNDGPRLLYARTPLLCRAGFTAGGYDAPVTQLHDAAPISATSHHR